MYFANEEVMTSKQYYTQSRIPGKIKAVFLKLGTRNVHHKINKMTAEEDPLSHSKRLQTGILSFKQTETGTKCVAVAPI